MTESSVSHPLYGPMLSRPVNGTSQPPKNSVAISALAVTMLQYSAIGKRENFIALYSVWYPAMSSDSASGRSNGSLLVSAKAATMKMKKAMVRLTTFHPPYACWFTIEASVTFPARSSTGIVDNPIEISYEIICALERSPPSRAYLLFDAQPAMTIPYTPSEEMARMKRKPTGRSATTMSTRPQRVGSGAPNGNTAIVVNAGMNVITGARMNNGLYAAFGYVSSFMKFFTPSATG